MKPAQIAAQLYTVRDFCQTASALAATARRIRAIGYEAAQLSGHGPIPEHEIAKIMAGEGLVICATHEPAAVILDQPERAIESLQKFDEIRIDELAPEPVRLFPVHPLPFNRSMRPGCRARQAAYPP